MAVILLGTLPDLGGDIVVFENAKNRGYGLFIEPIAAFVIVCRTRVCKSPGVVVSASQPDVCRGTDSKAIIVSSCVALL